jgi:hypothetical protein
VIQGHKTLTFTNINDEDLGVLYIALNQDEDCVDFNHGNDKLTGIDGENNESV